MITYNSYNDSLRREIVGLVASGQLTREHARRQDGLLDYLNIGYGVAETPEEIEILLISIKLQSNFL